VPVLSISPVTFIQSLPRTFLLSTTDVADGVCNWNTSKVPGGNLVRLVRFSDGVPVILIKGFWAFFQPLSSSKTVDRLWGCPRLPLNWQRRIYSLRLIEKGLQLTTYIQLVSRPTVLGARTNLFAFISCTSFLPFTGHQTGWFWQWEVRTGAEGNLFRPL